MANGDVGDQRARSRRLRIGAVFGAVVFVLTIWVAQVLLTRQFAEDQTADAMVRATLYAGNIQSTMQRHSVVPALLARDQILMGDLVAGVFAESQTRITAIRDELGVGAIMVLDTAGRVRASTDERSLDADEAERDYFRNASADAGTVFSIVPEGGQYGFIFARRVESEGAFLGVVAVKVDLGAIEESWRRALARVVVTNSDEVIILSSTPSWRRHSLPNLLAAGPGSSPIGSALRSAQARIGQSPYVYIGGSPHLRAEAPVNFRSWRLSYFATLEDVRARVNAILALMVMVMAVIAAIVFWYLSRRERAETRRIKRESDELRALNRRLSTEIAARLKLERNLKEAEQSLEQASKLAALGQMSAAVAHELNQPLAAMKTYLAGARILVQRKRSEEAMVSVQRIDDLIDRMGGITRQLKSYARKGEGDMELEDVDVRDSVRTAIAMMAPQLGKLAATITTTLPREPVIVRADPLRLEQIVVNLLRNAVDAVRRQDHRTIQILLVEGDSVLLSITDNGPGIKEPDKLFEPFYTTKRPGEGLGLGLAISAGFAAEMGGRLVARNAPEGGAVFELLLPRASAAAQAAE
jgi:two-component system, NtrC family, C4-dicarboxylate transport sensor histidine kinase DctB